jgi:C4-type Zn-finger protein
VPDVVEVPENLTNWRLGNIEGTLTKVLEKLDAAAGLEERVKRLEEWQTWALRIVVGAVLAGILALVVTTAR